MSVLRFSDGINIDTSGELRPLKLHDGWYVVGRGHLCPVADLEAAERLIQRMGKRDH